MTLGPGSRDLLTAVGLLLAIEGALYAAAPGAMKAMMAKARELPDDVFRWAGLVALVIGVAVVWLIRH